MRRCESLRAEWQFAFVSDNKRMVKSDRGVRMDMEKWRLIIIGGHTRSIGKTQLVCDVIAAFPRVNWIAGKITQYGHGVCAQNGGNCDCAPQEHSSVWLRTKQGFLAEGMPLLRKALQDIEKDSDPRQKKALIVESNSLMQFVKPSLYFAVIDPLKEDFKESAQIALDRANVLVLRGTAKASDDAPPAPLWMKLPAKLLQERPSVLQKEGECLPRPLESLVYQMLDDPGGVAL
jgi:hypothetical protein